MWPPFALPYFSFSTIFSPTNVTVFFFTLWTLHLLLVKQRTYHGVFLSFSIFAVVDWALHPIDRSMLHLVFRMALSLVTSTPCQHHFMFFFLFQFTLSATVHRALLVSHTYPLFFSVLKIERKNVGWVWSVRFASAKLLWRVSSNAYTLRYTDDTYASTLH